MSFDGVNIDIYNGNYSDNGTSKTKHLRCFWDKEPNHIVGKLLTDLLAHAHEMAHSVYYRTPDDAKKHDRILERAGEIAERLRRDLPVENLDGVTP